MQLKQGSLLQGGKYRIEKVLGQGGFGITYLGEQTSLGRKVAIKEFFMKELCNRDETTSRVSVGSEGSREMVAKFREKFLKEARNIASLEHPNIVSVIDVFEENGTAYYVMKYCDGGSLSSMMKEKYAHGMPEQKALKYIREVASALDYVHKRKMNHLDVKPANIMLNESDNAVLIDFGLSKQYDAETGQQTSSTPVGISEGYAPMEQYKKGGVSDFSPSTDIYSLGATLFKLITGQTPPSALDINEDGIPSFKASAPVKAAITAAMQSRRADRPQTVKAWLDMLDDSSAQDTEATVLPDEKTVTPKPEPKPVVVTPEPKPAPSSAPQPSKSNKPVIFGIIAAAVVALGILLFGGFGGGEDPVPPSPIPAPVAEEVVETATEVLTNNASVPVNPADDKPESVMAESHTHVAETPTPAAKPTTGSKNGHEWVDLGLPSGTKWATMNVGASSPSDYGSYFAWGETSPKSSYTWENLKYRISGDRYEYVKLSKYVTDSKYGNVDGKKELEPYDDAAYINWGSGWRMPSLNQMDELLSECTWSWSENGYQVTSKKNRNSIFLPAAGCHDGDSANYANSIGDYWSRTLNAGYSLNAHYLHFYSVFPNSSYDYRCLGFSVRPVLAP